MREDLGALISFDLGVAVAVYPGYRREQRQFLPVDCETIEHAALTLAHFERGQAQHFPGGIALIYGFRAELA
jgi:hypothetical protein